MPPQVLVRSSMRTWDFVLFIILGLGACAGGAILYGQNEFVLSVILLVLGGIFVIASMIGLQRRISRRQWIQLRSDGFTVLDRSGDSDYEDQQIQSLALRFKQNFSEGVEKSVTRTLILWMDTEDGDAVRLEFQSTFKTGVPDPLAEFIDRLSKLVFDRARELLSNGRTFAGDGWVLERRNLVVAAKPEPLHCPLDEIVMTGVVDQKLCLWRKGQDEVWARINIDLLNTYVLKWLIDERLAERPQEESARDGESLGRVLFERRPRSSTVVILALCTGILALLGFAMIAGGMADARDGVALIAVGLGMLALALACGLGIVHCRRAVFRCHQYGLVKRGLTGERKLRYEHVEAFTYQATRHFHNGVYTGTIFVLDFEPDTEHKSQRIKYNVTLRQADEELNNLRDQVAAIIGTRMQQQILAGRNVKWTPALAFEGNALIYTPVGFISRKAPVSIPVAEIELYKMDQGKCELFRKGQSKAVIHEDLHAKNFFPGFHCMLLQIGANSASETEAK